MLTRRPDLRDAADHAFRFLMDHCVDRANGGVYWSVTCDGKPLDTTKHTYNQAFAIYALSAYYRLSGNAQALALAKELFRLIETRCTDSEGSLAAGTVSSPTGSSAGCGTIRCFGASLPAPAPWPAPSTAMPTGTTRSSTSASGAGIT